MNIALLILGVLVILFSTILIIINTNDSENKSLDYATKSKSYEKESNYIENILDEQNISNEIIQVEKKSIEIEEKIDLEDEILYKDLNKTNLEINSDSQETLNITDEIIKMYKVEGLEVNEIAKKLKKGIREIEIILKINKMKD